MEASNTATTSALLEGLFDTENDAVWREFDTRYRPIVLAFATRLGAGPEDAADVAQETLLRFVREYRGGRYDRERGRLRTWIVAIARYRLVDVHRGRAAFDRGMQGDSVLVQLEDTRRHEQVWDEECRRAVVDRALQTLERSSEFHPNTLTAFRLFALERRPVSEVADSLGMTERAVYIAKHRCARRLRETIQQLEIAYELD